MTDSDSTPRTREIPIVTGELDVDGEPRSPSIAVVILAAGQGTRMRSPLPKVLHPVGRRTMLDRAIDAAEALGCAPVVVVVGTHAPAVRAAVEARLGPDAFVHVAARDGR